MISNAPIGAAAEGLPKERSISGIDTVFRNVADVVTLAADLLIEHYTLTGDHCELPIDIADQVISILVMTRDACDAKIAGASR